MAHVPTAKINHHDSYAGTAAAAKSLQLCLTL